MRPLLDAIKQEIQALSASDKEELLGFLLQELDGPFDGDVELAWRDEVHRRSRQIDAGTVPCIPADEVFARIDGQINR